MQARKMLQSAFLCLARALITGVPGGVRGAYDKVSAFNRVYRLLFKLVSHLQHETQYTKDRMEAFVVAFRCNTTAVVRFPGNTGHHFGNNSKIDDKR